MRLLEARPLRCGGSVRARDSVLERGGQCEGVSVVAERHELVELRERRAWDLLLLARVPADRCEHADRLRPREYCAAEAVHGVCEGELPREGSVVRVDHCKISVEAVDGVSDEGARFGAGHLATDGVENNEAV